MVTNLNDTGDKNTHTKMANPLEYHDNLDKGIYFKMKEIVTSRLIVWVMIVISITNWINLVRFPDCDCSRLSLSIGWGSHRL